MTESVKRWEQGRRFSRETRVKFNLGTTEGQQEYRAHMELHGERKPDGRIVLQGGVQYEIERNMQLAAEYLRSIGLPGSARVFTHNGVLYEEPPEDGNGHAMLWVREAIHELGYEADSLPELAARVLEGGTRLQMAMKHADIGQTAHFATHFGKDATLWRVYAIERAGAGPGRPKIARHWATYVAQALPVTGTKLQRWQCLPDGCPAELSTPIGDIEYYRDGDTLVAIIDGDSRHPKTMKQSNFFKRHLKGR